MSRAVEVAHGKGAIQAKPPGFNPVPRGKSTPPSDTHICTHNKHIFKKN